MTPPESLGTIRDQVVQCRKCPRLVEFRERVARERKKAYRDQGYWGRPVPGFGDPAARLVVVGLAPAAHGSNRTGRVFTGDRSAGFLVEALHAAGFANQPTSVERHDGLRYTGLYLTAAVRCVPPDNRPTPKEFSECAPYLDREFRALPETRAYLALGGLAWGAVLAAAARVHDRPPSGVAFAHGACAVLGPGLPLAYASYHPSPQNTNTGKLTRTMLVELLRRIRAGFEPPSLRREG